jgi:hypothetical protein
MPTYKSAAPVAIEPDGIYGFVVKKVKLGRSAKDPNIETVEVELDVEGTIVWETFTFNEKAAFKIDEFRESIGETVTPGEEVDVDPDDWIGATGKVAIFIDVYNGKEKNKVKEFLPPLVQPLPKTTAVAEGDDSDSDNIPY